ncbi:MAG: hypothetical protein Q9M35_10455 [Rhodothermus sp.]|nr:hypothetical protein [Rhodothermus sp.]
MNRLLWLLIGLALVAVLNDLLNTGDRIFWIYGGEMSKTFEGLPRG